MNKNAVKRIALNVARLYGADQCVERDGQCCSFAKKGHNMVPRCLIAFFTICTVFSAIGQTGCSENRHKKELAPEQEPKSQVQYTHQTRYNGPLVGKWAHPRFDEGYVFHEDGSFQWNIASDDGKKVISCGGTFVTRGNQLLLQFSESNGRCPQAKDCRYRFESDGTLRLREVEFGDYETPYIRRGR